LGAITCSVPRIAGPPSSPMVALASKQPAVVNVQYLAGDEGGLGGSKVVYCRGDVFGASRPPYRRLGDCCLKPLLRQWTAEEAGV
jgi:hypothetical protein